MDRARVGEVAEANAQVADDVDGDGRRERDAEERVGEGERVEVAVAQEESAGDESPDQGEGGEDGIRQMGQGKEGCGDEDGGAAALQQA